MAPERVVVYLDTQDFSRFGDVLRGKSDASTEKIFRDLEKRKCSGDVVFTLSMPLISELMQYDENCREITFKKAQAIEMLCGPWAIASPVKIIKSEIFTAARKFELTTSRSSIKLVTDDRGWFPDMSSVFEDLREHMKVERDKKIASLGLTSRKQRRQAKALVRAIKWKDVANEVGARAADDLDFPLSAIQKSLVPFMEGKINENQAAGMLFSEIAKPEIFVEIYFEKLEIEKSLPKWIKNSSANMAEKLRTIREIVLSIEDARKDHISNLIDSSFGDFANIIIQIAEDDEGEDFNISRKVIKEFRENRILCSEIPSVYMLIKAFESYVLQISGLSGSRSSVEESFGGDLFHALYIPHVDLWRGDRRFSHLMAKAVPRYSDKIVPKLQLLPDRITSCLRKTRSAEGA